jgi:hypothetical protein
MIDRLESAEPIAHYRVAVPSLVAEVRRLRRLCGEYPDG